MPIRNLLTILLVAAFLSGCTAYDFSKRYVQQGNLLSQARVERLKIGMSKADVAILMGTSLMSPLFSQDRWDYVYTWRKTNKPMRIRRLVLTFKNDRLAHIDCSGQIKP